MYVLLIYNPMAGNSLFKNYLDFIIGKFQSSGHQIIPYRVEGTEALNNKIKAIKPNEYQRILIAGGDGTINQVANSLLHNNIDLPIGIFPVGTANDFAQYFNLPKTIRRMTEIALSGKYTYSDVGRINDKYFINVASFGSIINVSQKTDTKAKNTLGVLAYYLKSIEEIPNIKPIFVTVESDECDFSGEIFFMLIMNGKSAGGFKKLAPFSSINDGKLDIYIFKNCLAYELFSLLLKVFNGEHIKSNHVIFFQTNKLLIDCDNNIGTDIDGEKGPDFPLMVENLPGKLRIIADV
ncbi:MAG: YegS/Rv2252/BmrU family lipid kinase [Clostridiales bacterium]|nr:YegS/Rv2252/BmrU family lipid kinase [Clostridiales bacterium]